MACPLKAFRHQPKAGVSVLAKPAQVPPFASATGRRLGGARRPAPTVSPAGRAAGRTLQLQFPLGHTIALAAIWLGLFLVAGEATLGLDRVQATFATPGLGSRHRQFEVQLGRLDRLVRIHGPMDCLLLGNSMVWLGIDPQIVARELERVAGRPVPCFNFGVSALPASSAGLIAPILVERYHPRLLVYGTFARDYAVPGSAEDAWVIAETHWVQYELGQPDVAGWLYAHSNLARYRDRLAELARLDFEDALAAEYGPPEYRAFGFDPKLDVRVDVRQRPDLGEASASDARTWLYHYAVQSENLEGLSQIAALSQHDTRVIVLEMPVAANAMGLFANGRRDYRLYLEAVASILASSDTPFWRSTEAPLMAGGITCILT
jgi:hypothetical protein